MYVPTEGDKRTKTFSSRISDLTAIAAAADELQVAARLTPVDVKKELDYHQPQTTSPVQT